MPACSGRFTPLSRRHAARTLKTGLRAVAAWLRRCADRARQRRALDRLDDRLLRDVGLTRAHVRSEMARPFWRA